MDRVVWAVAGAAAACAVVAGVIPTDESREGAFFDARRESRVVGPQGDAAVPLDDVVLVVQPPDGFLVGQAEPFAGEAVVTLAEQGDVLAGAPPSVVVIRLVRTSLPGGRVVGERDGSAIVLANDQFGTTSLAWEAAPGYVVFVQPVSGVSSDESLVPFLDGVRVDGA